MRAFTSDLGILSSFSCGAQMDSIAVITWVGSISCLTEPATAFRMLLIALLVRRDVCARTESRIKLDSCSSLAVHHQRESLLTMASLGTEPSCSSGLRKVERKTTALPESSDSARETYSTRVAV